MTILKKNSNTGEIPISIGYSPDSTTMFYLSGNTDSGTVTAQSVPALGAGSLWVVSYAPGDFLYVHLHGKTTEKRYLRGMDDNTVTLVDDCTLPRTQWKIANRKSSSLWNLYCETTGSPLFLSYDTQKGLILTKDGKLNESYWTLAPGIDATVIEAYVKAFAPILRFHPNEQYKMCSIEWYLSNASLYDKKTGTSILHPTIDQLPTTMDADDPDRFSLNMSDAAKGGSPSTAKAYIHALVEYEYTDLQFWFFYGYNGPGTAHVNSLFLDTIVKSGDPTLKPLGEHWGDWELAVIRIDNSTKQPIGVWLSQHDSGKWFEKDDLKKLERQGTQFVFYASRNGHAIYPSASSNYTNYWKGTHFPLGLEFWLRNDTAVGGDSFDASKHYQIVATDLIWNAPTPAVWLSYPYRWGPVGTESKVTIQFVYRVLYDAFGFLGLLLSGFGLVALATILARRYVHEDINGPEGPEVKTATWHGHYS